MSNKKLTILIILVLITPLIMAACSSTQEPQVVEQEVTRVVTVEVEKIVAATPEPGEPTTLVVADPESNSQMDPFRASLLGYPHLGVFTPLVTLGKEKDWVGVLADSWESSPDGKIFTIHLIKNAKFTDGTPVDAEAIRWNLMKYVDPDEGTVFGEWLIGILEDVEVVDDYTVRLHLSTPYASILYVLYQMGIASPTAYEKWGEDFGMHPVGAGPWILKEWVTDNYAVLVRNPDFNWAPKGLYEDPGPVRVDEMIVKFITEDQTRLAALKTGEVQVARIPDPNVDEMLSNPDVRVYSYGSWNLFYLGFNCQSPPWDNRDLRWALAHAVNRNEVAQLAWEGHATPVLGPLTPAATGYNPELMAEIAAPYDPTIAMQLLDDLGYKDVDGDGFREDPDGKPWNPSLITSSVTANFRRGAEVLEAQLRAVGVKVELNVMDSASLMEMTKAGTHELFFFRYAHNDPNVLQYFFKPEFIGASNRARYANEELAALLTKADQMMDPAERLEVLDQIQESIVTEAPWIPLLVENVYVGVRKELVNWEFTPDGTLLYWNAYFTD